MELHDGIETIGLALYLKEHKALILADVHIGFEESLEKQGVLVPRFHLKDILSRIDAILKALPVKLIIFNGDLKHEFGKITKQEWRELTRLFEFLKDKVEKIVIVKGNHDVSLGPVALREGISMVKEYSLGDILITHGDALVDKKSPCKILIMGHEHPAVSLKAEGRVERYKCFIKGKYGNKILIAQPSFHQFTEGTDVLQGSFLSPLLKVCKNMVVFIHDAKKNEVLPFGKLDELR